VVGIGAVQLANKRLASQRVIRPEEREGCRRWAHHAVHAAHAQTPVEIPSTGRVVASATFPGAERPLALSVPDSLRHLHVIGPTGSGKSTMLVGLIAGDMEAGRGVVVLDPKGDLVADVLERVPAHRLDDVCILDPGDDVRPVGLNLLTATEADGDS